MSQRFYTYTTEINHMKAARCLLFRIYIHKYLNTKYSFTCLLINQKGSRFIAADGLLSGCHRKTNLFHLILIELRLIIKLT